MSDKAHAYIGAKIIQAEPEERDGKPGYRMFYPDGYVSWSPRATFEGAYRRVSTGEARLISFGSDDVVEAALDSAGDRSSDDCTSKDGKHDFCDYDASTDDERCRFCKRYKLDVERSKPPPGGP